MTGISVWDHRPDAAGILADRVQRGWKPTPSLLKDGDRVLGYASCLVDSEHSSGGARSDSTEG